MLKKSEVRSQEEAGGFAGFCFSNIVAMPEAS